MSIHSILSTSTAGLGMRYMLIHPLKPRQLSFFFLSSFLSIHVNADFLRSDQEDVRLDPYNKVQVIRSSKSMSNLQKQESDTTCMDSASRQHL